MTAPTSDLAALADIAEDAGRAILQVRAQGFRVEYKQDDSPLTQADTAAHEVIMRGLARAFPGVPVLSEEGADIPYETRARWERLFIVDPLDGTKEFVKELGEFCVCIALARGGFPALGAVHAPVWGKTYVGGLGLGAFRREVRPGGSREHETPWTDTPWTATPWTDGPWTDGPWTAIHVRQPGAGLVALASRSHPDAAVEAWLADKDVGRRMTAGSALKFCLVAEGAADLYPRFNPTHEWDTAAGQAVLEGAGGGVLLLKDGLPAGRMPVNTPGLVNGPFLASARAQ